MMSDKLDIFTIYKSSSSKKIRSSKTYIENKFTKFLNLCRGTITKGNQVRLGLKNRKWKYVKQIETLKEQFAKE